MTNMRAKYKSYLVVSLHGRAHTGYMTTSNRHGISQLRALREAIGPGFTFVGPSEQILRTITGTNAQVGGSDRGYGRD